MRLTLFALASMIAFISYALWPVCVPLTAEQVVSFQPSIAQRTDKDFHLRIFQQRAGQWHQCKTRISRAMFF
jgi:hypothetical protein